MQENRISLKILGNIESMELGRMAHSVSRLTYAPEVPGSIPGPATEFRFPIRCLKKGSCQLLAKVCARIKG